MLKILALDFDGVIVDSVLECLFVSYNTYLKVYKRNGRELFSGKPFTFENWEKDKKNYQEKMKYFYRLRSYIRGATDYGLIQKLMEEKKLINNQEEFDKYRGSVNFNFEDYNKEFYKERERLQNINYMAWSNLEPPYPKIIEGIKKIMAKGVKVVIATSNRRKAIMKSFTPEFFGFFIEPKDILDKRFGEDKSEQMKHIVESYKVQFEDIYFVDDQVSHLIQVKPLGVEVFLAGWSYATKKQKVEARRLNIPIIEKEEQFLPTLENMLK